LNKVKLSLTTAHSYEYGEVHVAVEKALSLIGGLDLFVSANSNVRSRKRKRTDKSARAPIAP